jgi:hypothetical protein
MTILTGTSGELRYNNARIAKCRDYSLEISRDALETTSLGDPARTYTAGIRGATGSATILYDRDDINTRNLLNSIMDDEADLQSMSFVLDVANGQAMNAQAVITSVSTPVSVGDVVACSVNFQISGDITGVF